MHIIKKNLPLILTIIILTIIIGSASYLQKDIAKSFSQNENKSNLDQQLINLEASLANINAKVDLLNDKYNQLSKVEAKITTEKDNDNIKQHLIDISTKIAMLDEQLNATGLESLATNNMIDVSVLSDLYKKLLKPKLLKEYRLKMEKLAKVQHADDIRLYGENFEKDYQNLIKGFNNTKDSKDELKFYDDFLAKYPDSYAACSIIIMQSVKNDSIKEDTESFERLYELLRYNDKYQNAILEDFKPLPSIQSFLAEKYIEDERFDEAKELIARLEQNPEDLVQRINGEALFASELILNLRKKIK